MTTTLQTDTENVLEFQDPDQLVYGWVGPKITQGANTAGSAYLNANPLMSAFGIMSKTPANAHVRTMAVQISDLDANAAALNTTFDIQAVWGLCGTHMGGTFLGVGSPNGPHANEGARWTAGSKAPAGLCIGDVGLSGNGLINIGKYGRAVPSNPSTVNGPCVGILGSAALGPNNVGGYFTLATTDPTFNEDAGVIADNGDSGKPVALFKVNGKTVVQIDATGNLQVLVNGVWKNVAVQP